MNHILEAIRLERERQQQLFPDQSLPEGVDRQSAVMYGPLAAYLKKVGTNTWSEVLLEEVYEALSETDPKERKKELVQVAAVCVKWLEEMEKL